MSSRCRRFVDQLREGGQFFSDESRNHCLVDLLHDLSRGTSFVSQFTNLPYHLLNPSRRTHIIGSFLKAAFGRLKPVATGRNRPIAVIRG